MALGRRSEDGLGTVDVDFIVKLAKAHKVENAFGCAESNVVKNSRLRH